MTCTICGERHSAYECAVDMGDLELFDRFGERRPVVDHCVAYLVGQGWAALLATAAALKFTACNDDWTPWGGAA